MRDYKGDHRKPTGYLVRGHYCPTDANPEQDADEKISETYVDTLEEAEAMLYWYPGGEIVPLEEGRYEDTDE